MQQSTIIKQGGTFRNADAIYADRTLWGLTSTGEPLEFFDVTATITSAAAATAVSLIADAVVGTSGRKVYLQGWSARVNGATGWGTTATVKIQDTNGTPVDFVTMAVAALTNAARVQSGSSNVTLEDAFYLGTGGTANKGLQIKGDANGTGSNLVVRVFGYIK